MKRYFSLIALSIQFFNALGQTLNVVPARLSFGNVYENAPATQQLTVSNPLSYTVNVKKIKFFNIYGQPAFTCDLSSFSLSPGASRNLNVTFSPLHNIEHNSEMVIETDAKGGNLSVDLLGQGKYSIAYYNDTENKAEEQLKTTLKSILAQGYVSFSYSIARDKMFMQIDNKMVNGQGASQNTLECIYTGRNISGFSSRSVAQGAPYNFNTEHTFPQSKFNSALPMYSDIHHLFPTDAAPNNSRGNYPFGIATTPYINSNINSPSQLGSNYIYEPRNAQKGVSARAMMYFVIRYQDYQSFFAPQEAILKTWNKTFVPNSVEKKRNDDIFLEQRNRNPFADYPQLADRITNFVSFSSSPSVFDLYQTGLINFGAIIPNTNYTHHYVLVNPGNQTLQISNLQLSNNSLLRFSGGTGSNVTLLPGEAHTIKVDLNLPNPDSLNETLTFRTNMQGNMANISVPVVANKVLVPLSAKEPLANKTEIFFFPNPANDDLFVMINNVNEGVDIEIEAFDAVGKLAGTYKVRNGETVLDISSLRKGIYHFKIREGNAAVIKKVIKL